MNVSDWLSRICLLAAAVLLAAGYWLSDNRPVVLVVAVLAIAGLIFLWRGWGWVLSVLLVLFTGLAAAGFYLDVAPAWMILGILACLAAWDQEHFTRRIQHAGRINSKPTLIREHLTRLAWVSLSGLLLVGLTFLIRVEFTFGLASLLSVLAILGLSQGIAYLRRSGGG